MNKRPRRSSLRFIGFGTSWGVLRKVLWGVLWGVLWVAVLSFYRGQLVDELARRDLEILRPVHATLEQTGNPPPVLPPEILGVRKVPGSLGSDAWIQKALETAPGESPTVFQHGRKLEILLRQGEKGVIYTFDASALVWRMFFGIFLGLVLAVLVSHPRSRSRIKALGLTHLRSKLVATLILVNLLTAGIIFWSLSVLQTREQTRQIEKQSLIFSTYTTERLIRSFLNSFESAFFEKFLPEVRSLIASNDDLIRIRIISAKNQRVLYDSDKNEPGSSLAAQDRTSSDFTPELAPELADELAARGIVTRSFSKDGGRWFSVLNTFRGPSQEPLFRVEYTYAYRSLERSLESMRSQILLDLIPSLALGAILALAFAQFLISPIRRLMNALGKVSSGDYSTSVAVSQKDEIGELALAFNAMASELRRKQELRKYLSNFSYEQITKAVDLVASEGQAEIPRLGGTRVSATILFCDIREFVSLCESLEAEEVTSLLNAYFSEMVAVIHKYGGEVDKFMGDAILAVFYPDQSKASEAATSLQAVYCALEMRSRLASFNEKRRAAGKPGIEIGVGISFGEIISGPIGAENRMDFTVIGDVVNVASRIEKLSKQGKHTRILFSDSIEAQVNGLLQYEELAESIRGKSEQIRVYELIGIRDLQVLIDQLKSSDPKLRARSVEVLGQSGNARALASVIEALGDADEAVRILACHALSRLALKNDDECVRAVFDRLDQEGSPRVASALVACIGKICKDERVLRLEPWLDSKDERIVANAIESIGQARSPRGTDLVLSRLDSRNHRIKANAAMAAFSAGRFEVIDILKPMLMHSDPFMRSSAAFAIGELSSLGDVPVFLEALRSNTRDTRQLLAELQECVPMLVALLKDPEAMVKRQAVIALGKIRDRGTVLPLIGLLETPEILPDVLEALRTIGSHRLVRELLSQMV